jgi:O-antigen/teichoic acid export membrane protein
LNRFLGFLLLPVYTHYFSTSEFGVFSLVSAFWFFAAVFYLYGMETSFQKFYIESIKTGDRSLIFSNTIIQITTTSVIFSCIIYLLSGQISYLLTGTYEHGILIKIVSVLLFVDSLSRFPMIAINAEQRAKIYTFINISGVIVNLLFNILFIVVLRKGIEYIFYAQIISYLYIFAISFASVNKVFKAGIDIQTVKNLTKFAHSFLYYGLFLISLDIVDRFFLSHFYDESTVGVYSACYRIGMVMNLLISGFRTAWIPFFMNMKDKENNKEIFSKVFSYFVYAGMLLFLIIALFANDLVQIHIGSFYLILAKDYWSGLVIIPYILLAYFLFGLYTNLNIASYFENKIRYLIISSGCGFAANILLNILLIPPYGIIGAALSTMASYLVMFIVLYILSQRVFYIKYQWSKVILVVFLALVLYMINSIGLLKITDDILFLNIFKVFSVFLLIFVLFKYFFPQLKSLKTVKHL